MVTRWPWLMAHNPRICPIRITPCPPNPEIRISVRVLVGACMAMLMGPSPGAAGSHVILHALLQTPQKTGEFRPAVGSVMLDAGLPPEIAVAAVGLPACCMLLNPFQILQGITGAERVGAKVLVAREAYMDERE